MTKGMSRRAQAALYGVSALAMGFALATEAQAQTAPAAADAPAAQVVVTASRVQRLGFTAPTPTAVQTTAVMQQQGVQNLGVFLEQAPAIRGTADNHFANTAQNNLYVNPAATYLNLRNLGNGQTGSAARTLVLVDGQRFAFESSGGAVNINSIPTIALDHTDIVTGGSSAAYGSEAVAGVVNLVLKQNFEGLQVEGQGGVSTYGDDKQVHFGIMGGHSFLDGKLHVMAAAEYNYETGIGPIPGNPRPFEAIAGYSPGVVGAGGVRYRATAIQTNAQTYGGLITGCGATAATPAGTCTSIVPGGINPVSSPIGTSPFHGIQFTGNGNVSQFGYGNTFGATGSGLQSGGSNAYDNNNDTADILQPSRHFSSLWRANYDVNPHFNVGFNFIYAFDSTDHPTVTPRWPGGSGANPLVFTVASGNPYIPTTVQNLMTANSVSSLTLGKVLSDFGPFEVHADDQTYNGSLDFKGDFDALAQNWTWDAHAMFGSVRVGSANLNDTLDQPMRNALDAVRVTTGNVGASGLAVGSIACRSTLTAPTNGCSPLNPFGTNVNNQAVNAYIHAPAEEWQTTQREDINANIHGNPFNTWAGPVSVAAGLEYRRDSIDLNSDPNSQARLFYGDNNIPYSGSINVTEGYMEAVVPLVHDMPLAKEIDFDGSGRYASYNLSGGNWSYKFGGTWTIVDDFRIRGSVSQDVRAPNVTELFQSATPGTQLLNIRFPSAFTPGQSTASVPLSSTITSNVQGNAFTQGNLNLKPEVAETYTYGAVFSPTFNPYLRGFRLSVDYYNITINQAIAAPTAQNIINFCQAGQTAYCADLTYVPQGNAFSYQELLQPINIGFIKTSGIDIVADYTTPLNRFWAPAPGVLSLNWSGNYVAHLIQSFFGVQTDTAGEVGGGLINANPDTPHWVWDSNIHYQIKEWGLNAHLHYVGGGVLDVSAEPGQVNAGLIRDANGTVDNNVPSVIFVNLGLNYDVPKAFTWEHSMSVYFNVNNVFNQAPPLYGRDSSDDLIGRYFVAGFRAKF